MIGIWTGIAEAGLAVLANFLSRFPTQPHSATIEPMGIDKAYQKFMRPFKLTPHVGFFLQSQLLSAQFRARSTPDSSAHRVLAKQLDKLRVLETFALIWMDPRGGAVSAVGAAATAFPWRAAFKLRISPSLCSTWRRQRDPLRRSGWTRLGQRCDQPLGWSRPTSISATKT